MRYLFHALCSMNFGGTGWIRTSDQAVMSRLLLPLSYGPVGVRGFEPLKPLQCQCSALIYPPTNCGYYWTRTSDLHNVNVAL